MDNKKTILAIDDQPSILSTVKNVLKPDYNVYCMTTHTEALGFLEKHTPDLILLDVEMPEVSGIELLGRLKSMDKLKYKPIVFLTGSPSMSDWEHIAPGTLDGFILKPIGSNFVETIKEYLKER